MSGLTRERGDTVIGPRTSQSVLSSLLYRLRVNLFPVCTAGLRFRPGGPKDSSPRREPWVPRPEGLPAPAGRQTRLAPTH